MKEPLSITHPQIAAQWHSTKNDKLTPDKVIVGSRNKAWWKCPKGSDHEWEARIAHRVNGSGCPFCAGHKPSRTNCLSRRYPEIAKEWHPTNNGTLTPDQILAGSGKKAWWRCPKDPDHEWKASIVQRVKGSGCPYCSRHKVSDVNSLSILYPEIAAQWHSIKNREITPDQVSVHSNKKIWWQCSASPDHEWETSIANRVSGKGCRFCAGREVSPTHSLASRYPEIAKEWHPTKNGTLTPNRVLPGSHKKAWWLCSIDLSHEWEAVIKSRVAGSGCSACNKGWTVQAIRTFVASLINHLKIFT
ncbi:MAG: zinc-ribbon domain-containing protein, partial [Cyanobacteriota bacterium]